MSLQLLLFLCLCSGSCIGRVHAAIMTTPFGDMDQKCVRHIPNDVILMTNGDLHFPNGATEKFTATPCDGLNFTSSIPTTEWFVRTEWYQEAIAFDSFTATYQVPAIPSINEGQYLHWFIGLHSMKQLTSVPNRIMQPVLTYYGPSTHSEWLLPGWSMRNWDCCIQGMAWYGNAILGLTSGDLLLGSITQSAINGQVYYTTSSSWKGERVSMRSEVASGTKFNLAKVALEPFHVSDCEDFPPTPVVFSNIRLSIFPGVQKIPQWTTSTSSAMSLCNANAQVTNTTVTLGAGPTVSGRSRETMGLLVLGLASAGVAGVLVGCLISLNRRSGARARAEMEAKEATERMHEGSSSSPECV